MKSEDLIAVVGVGCNFPGGEGVDNFWRVLLEGRNCASDIPAERFDSALWYDPDDGKPGKTQTKKAAFINGFNEFDHKFFGITEAEANFMDPQQKLLLHCTYRALEDAGISMESISGSRTGVIIGLMNRDYETLKSDKSSTINHYNATGTAMSISANRVSFTFNLTGPSFAIDSACSSSLVALHLACQSLRQGDCEMAVCGGVSCIIEPRVFVALSKAKMISPEGISKPFSTKADGYGRGEGCGVVLLKPLKNAIQDCNKIWGIISKTAVNQDGRHVSPITKPSMLQQEQLLRQLYSEEDVANVQYIEAHGTGTAVGDTTEACSIANVIATAKPATEMLKLGSVKGNIGHTESAAGVAGLIKVLLMMRHETFVPSLFFSNENASIDTKTLKLNIMTGVERWEKNGSSERVAGINSFGFGGTNAHAIVKEYKHRSIPTQIPKCCPKVFVISAATEKLLQVSINDFQQKLSHNNAIDLQELSYTSACGRSHSKHKYRKAFLATSISDLQQQLAIKTKVESTKADIQLVFVFCGNGVAYRGMCSQLLRDEPIFREKIREVEKAFSKYKSIDISQKLAGDNAKDDFTRPDVVQPLLFALQAGIVTLLKQWGIKPDIVLGHSVGEVAAAHCSGLLSLEDAVKVIYHRSNLQSTVTGGKMLVVGNVAVEDVLTAIVEFKDSVCVAAYNSPQSCTLSGEGDAIDILHQKLSITFADKNVFLFLLDVPAAYHSPKMEPILDPIEKNIDTLNANNNKCQLFSTMTGKRNSVGNFCTGSYWAKNMRQPVLFAQTLQVVAQERPASETVVFVEISPRKALQRSIQETLGRNCIVLSSVEPENDSTTILSTVAKLFELGVNVNWHKIYKGYETIPIELPSYHFETTSNEEWFERLRKFDLVGVSSHPLIRPSDDRNAYMCNLSVENTPYIWEHKNNGVPIVPGAFHVELAYASIMASSKPKMPISTLTLGIEFQSLCSLNSENLQLKVKLDPSGKQGTFKIDSSASIHASGIYKWSDGDPLIEEPCICLDTISQRCTSKINSNKMYSVLGQAGFEYGDIFTLHHHFYYGDEYKEAMAPVEVPGELLKDFHEYLIHPVLLDYFLQMTAVVAMQELTAKQGFPTAIDSIVIAGPLQKQMLLYLRASKINLDLLEVCGCFANTKGKVLVELKGVKISFMNPSSIVKQSLFFHNEMLSITSEQSSISKIKCILFEDRLGFAKALRPFLDTESISVEQGPQWTAKRIRDLVLTSNCISNNVIFMWAVDDLSHMTSEKTLEVLVNCCMQFQQIVLALKDGECSSTVRVVTYRSTETTVNNISPGFVFHGLTRACAAEMPRLKFQLIDLASVTSDDIEALVYVLNTCPQQEVIIKNGQIQTTRIVRTPVTDMCTYSNNIHSVHLKDFSLWTSDPYKMTNLSAYPSDNDESLDLDLGFVEVELTDICIHSADYFPVSTSQFKFGDTLYWNKHVTQNHMLLALDFSGVVTAVGKNVRNLEVGDHIATCYPVACTSKARIPETACFNTSVLSYLKETPCVSLFVLAWEILQRQLANVKMQCRKLAIISSNPASIMMKVLALTANRSGWSVSSDSFCTAERLERSHAVVFLTPFDHGHIGSLDQPIEETHFVFVNNGSKSFLSSMHRFAARHDNIHVHKVEVLDILQKAKLQAQNKMITNWLISLGFASASLPLKRETISNQSTEAKERNKNAESYFTTNTIKQVVLDHEQPDCPLFPMQPKQKTLFKKHNVYVVTGGLSGLGWETVKFIAENGGDCITTLSRSSPSEKMQVAIEELQKRFHVKVLNLQCDVSVSLQVDKAISKIQQRFPTCPVKGVFHSAVVLHDGLMENLDGSLFSKVLRPKVCGALNLHYATLQYKLDYFVCYSSVSSFIGNASQCNYAAANSFLDTFCQYRRNLGLVGQSINWGPLNLGLLLNKDHFQMFLKTKGLMVMDVCEVHETLKMCLLMDRVQQMICKFNFNNLHYHVLSQNAFLRQRLSALVQTELKDVFASEPPVCHNLSTQESVRRIVSDLIHVSVDELNDNTALCALGIDSMLAMTLQNKVFQETSINVPLVKILDPNCTVTTLQTVCCE
ncbi:phthioceranic/hydroxyphthioceranic acid synthase-like [Eucyclogobius newberryi]|uniref:phthioceranic/hydroxyphthioceranic acid synthase-like n=1 Tax=Eucyclogobius newberryi TaxID=166745 RepID=UPI003B5BC52E